MPRGIVRIERRHVGGALDWPSAAEVVALYTDPWRDELLIVIEHPDLPETPEGQTLPMVLARYVREEDASGRRRERFVDFTMPSRQDT